MSPILASAVRAFGLTAQEAHVVEQRLGGRSFGQIATDPVMRRPGRAMRVGPRCASGQFSRQRLQQFERDAARKLGLPGSIEETVHAAERLDRAIVMRDRGRLLNVTELRADPRGEVRARQGLTPEERDHERRAVAFLRSKGAA